MHSYLRHPWHPRIEIYNESSVLVGGIKSTLDTKEGYKTKNGSTSSVTRTLTSTLTLTLALTPGYGELLLGSKMESNDVAKAAMNEIWGICAT